MTNDQNTETGALTEPRIIAENDTHVVVSIRVSKSWLAQNMHLLAALGEDAAWPESELLASLSRDR